MRVHRCWVKPHAGGTTSLEDYFQKGAHSYIFLSHNSNRPFQ